MINNKKVLAFIPARGGSKGIKNKNIISVGGKPLIAYSIEAARNSKYVDKIFVSTDSDLIAETVTQFGVDSSYRRPEMLASDTAKTIDAVLDGIKWLEEKGEMFDIVLLLQPTSPLRTEYDIDGALETFIRYGEEGLVSVSPVRDHPILMRQIGEDGRLERFIAESSTVRRQDMKPYYRVNGSIYINMLSDLDENTSFNDNPIPYCIPIERSVDIDNMSDVALVEYYLQNPGVV